MEENLAIPKDLQLQVLKSVQEESNHLEDKCLSDFFKQEIKLGQEQLNNLEDKRPSDYIYALMSQHVYEGESLEKGGTLPGYPDWKVEIVKRGRSDYFGIIYVNQHEKQVVVTHRGSDNIGELEKYLNNIYPNHF